MSAPCKEADLTVVYGVNDADLTQQHHVVSNASCTTNCLAPVAKTLNDAIGIRHGYMTTVHSYTGDQRPLDTFHNDFFRARAAAANLIPTSTGAARAVGLVLPELAGKLDGAAIRVPTPNVSLIDLKFTAERKTNIDEINDAVRAASSNGMAGILAVNDNLWCRLTSITIPPARPSIWRAPRWSTIPSAALCPGMTMNGLLQPDERHGGCDGAPAVMNASFDNLHSADSADVAGKRVLLRVDLNVPVANGAVTDATRIQRVLPTLKSLTARGAKVIVLSHFGRPKGKPHPDMSLKTVADEMRAMLGGNQSPLC